MDLSFWFTIFVGSVAIILLLILWHLNSRYGYIEDLGIPILPSKFLLGTPPFNHHEVLFHQYDIDCFDELKTKTYGRYDGTQPTIVTRDPSLIKGVFVKHFDAFKSRDNFKAPDDYSTLDISHGETWKSLRKGLSPIFTTGKLKNMVMPITEMADRLIAHVRHQVEGKEEGDVIDVRPLLQGYTFDVIGKCAYGVDFDIVKVDKISVEKPMIMKATQSFIDDFYVKDFATAALWNVLYNFTFVFYFIPTLSKDMFHYVQKLTKGIVDKREKENASDTGDFIDRLRSMSAAVKASGMVKHEGLTEGMILSQGVIFLAAGFETTSSTMAILLFYLAKHPEAQKKCFDEIIDVQKGGENIDHETVSRLAFLECCILETLRLSPPVIRNQRLCSKKTTIDGLTIKAGTVITVPTYALQRDKDLFGDNADTFSPDRFWGAEGEELSKSVTFHAFGCGPRICVGMRFAMIEMKITIAKLLKEFEILDENRITNLSFKPGSPFILKFDEIKVKIKPRI